MPARKSSPADRTGESLFGNASVHEEPDGGPDLVYENRGNGLVTSTPKNYNERYSRRPDSPTVGGPRSTPGTYSHPKDKSAFTKDAA